MQRKATIYRGRRTRDRKGGGFAPGRGNGSESPPGGSRDNRRSGKLYAASGGRQVDALLANAGRGLGHGFLDQDFGKARRVIDTNITGTVYLIHKIGNDMRRRNAGKIVIVGSIAGFTPGSFQAVYNGTKAFLNSFSFALREELQDTKVTVPVSCRAPPRRNSSGGPK